MWVSLAFTVGLSRYCCPQRPNFLMGWPVAFSVSCTGPERTSCEHLTTAPRCQGTFFPHTIASVVRLSALQRSLHPILPLPPTPPVDQPDALKHHGKSGRGHGGEVRRLMTLNFIFSDLAHRRGSEGGESARPTGEEPLTGPSKNRRRRYIPL